jgi:hypothetical protein
MEQTNMTTTSPTNALRAHWAALCIGQFIDLTNCDREDSLGDLLANLMHWARFYNFDFDAALERGRAHFDAELVDEQWDNDPGPSEAASTETTAESEDQSLQRWRVTVSVTRTEHYEIDAASEDEAMENAFIEGDFVGEYGTTDVHELEAELVSGDSEEAT